MLLPPSPQAQFLPMINKAHCSTGFWGVGWMFLESYLLSKSAVALCYMGWSFVASSWAFMFPVLSDLVTVMLFVCCPIMLDNCFATYYMGFNG